MGARILVVDDQKNMRTTLRVLLRGLGHQVEEAGSFEEASKILEASAFDVVLTDLRLGQPDGIAVLARAKELRPETEVIVMTAFGTIDSAVEAMRLGAHDYIQKPFSESEMTLRLDRALEKGAMYRELRNLTAELRERYGLEQIVGKSALLKDLLMRIVRTAQSDATVLITGESGTGKELVARAIHVNSARAASGFVSINCAALSEDLLASELFGHVKGAFTGALSDRQGIFVEAEGGTVFLDEIGETSLIFQAKLLRVLQEREVRPVGGTGQIKVNVRVLAATHQNLRRAVEDKRFREDLFYRLNVVNLELPPLRERREDIPLLIQHFVQKYSRRERKRLEVSEDAVDVLVRYDFPGNIRELENLVEQAVTFTEGGMIALDDLVPPTLAIAKHNAVRSLQDALDEAERRAIEDALIATAGSREKTAELLGLSVTTLWRKMKRLGM